MPDLSVSIVTYNSENMLPDLLQSIKLSSGISVEVYVIDNASKDNSCRLAGAILPDAQIIRLPKNVGYGRANNIAIRKATARYHLVVNPDVRFEPDLLARSIEFLDEHKEIVLLSPRVFFPDGREQFVPKHCPSLFYLAGGLLEKLTRRENALRSAYTLRNEAVDPITDIDFGTGCFMLMRGEALRRLGGFDERFFLYFEDADLTMRLQAFGRTVYVPSISIVHRWSRENMKLSCLRHELASMLRFFTKWRHGHNSRMTPAKRSIR